MSIRYKLFNDECNIKMKQWPDNLVDLTVTSPPYDNLRTYNGFEFDYRSILMELFRITKIGGVVVWIVSDQTIDGNESGSSFLQALYAKEIGFKLHDTMIWDKQEFSATGSLKVRYASVFDYMFIFSKLYVKTFNPIKDRTNVSYGRTKHGTVRQIDGSTKPQSNLGKPINEFGQRHNIWRINAEKHRIYKHPAMFPIELVKDHILSWSNENDLVLDPMMGSGTTGVASLTTNRRFLGIEISSEYFSIAKDRIEKAYQESVTRKKE